MRVIPIKRLGICLRGAASTRLAAVRSFRLRKGYGATRGEWGASNMPFCETNPNSILLESGVSIVIAIGYVMNVEEDESGSFGKRSRFDGSGRMFLTWYQGVVGIWMVWSVILYEGRRVGGREMASLSPLSYALRAEYAGDTARHA